MNFSVLTLVRNRRSQLENLLRGLRFSTVTPRELVIVFMNESPYDNLPELDFPVRHVELTNPQVSIPLAEARNLAARHATSEWLLFLDVDCVPAPDLLAVMQRYQQQESQLLMGDIRYLPKGATTGKWDIDELYERGVPHPERPGVARNEYFQPDSYTLFWSLCFSIAKKDFNRLGGFDETYLGYGGEDTDFAFMADRAGIKFGICGGLAYHQYHDVHRPPLNNFKYIVHNAQVFRRKWNRWAMENWLAEFADHQLIDWQEEDEKITVHRQPTPYEVAATLQQTAQGY